MTTEMRLKMKMRSMKMSRMIKDILRANRSVVIKMEALIAENRRHCRKKFFTCSICELPKNYNEILNDSCIDCIDFNNAPKGETALITSHNKSRLG